MPKVRATSAVAEASQTEEIEIAGEKVPCRRVDMLKEFETAFTSADSYRKVGKVEARQAIERGYLYESGWNAELC